MNKQRKPAYFPDFFISVLLLSFLIPVVWFAAAEAQPVVPATISGPAYALLTNRSEANRTRFLVYENADSGFNHGFPSGFFGQIQRIHIDPACIDTPTSPNGCAPGQNRLDRRRGNVFRISFDALGQDDFAGLNFEEPRNWGVTRIGKGYDLRRATHVVFDVRTQNAAGTSMRFGVGDCVTAFLPIHPEWETKRIPLASLTCRSGSIDLSSVHILFTVVTNGSHAPFGATVLLDNIRFVPLPPSQRTVPSFPLSTQTFGIRPSATARPGRVPIPSDQVLRNLTTTYESAITLQALIARGTPRDLVNARRLADAMVYALGHENQGLALPSGLGARGLHNGYESGDLSLFNNQDDGPAKAGQIRLAGFSASQTLCGPTGYCVVLDGATGGNNAFAMLALLDAHDQFQDTQLRRRYLNAAKTIGNWIFRYLADRSSESYGGYFLGFEDGGRPNPIFGKSVENNADIFVAFSRLASLEQGLGSTMNANMWMARAYRAGDFVMRLFDVQRGCFYAGTVPAGPPAPIPAPGIQPDGPRRGQDVINTFDFFDSNSFTTLALARSDRYRNALNWRRPVRCVIDHFAQAVRANGVDFRGFNIVTEPTEGPNGIALEFTAQAVVLMRFVDQLYNENRFTPLADFYLMEIADAQRLAPFGDGLGLVASILENIRPPVPPSEQCLSTPFQCIAARVGLAATVWGIFAEQNLNPLSPEGLASAH